MKLYYHPVSTTSRAVMLFIADQKLPVDYQLVDLMKGEHYKPEFAAINPSRLVPTLEDGSFRLSESSAILKYLAERFESATYPRELKARARVNELMDWINTQLCRDLAYGLVYPQVFPTHKRPSEEQQKAQLAWSCERAKSWMKVLDESILGPNNKYLCGDKITLADYFAASFVSLAEFIRCDFGKYPNVERWYRTMKALPSWNQVHEIFYGFAGSMKDVPFEVV